MNKQIKQIQKVEKIRAVEKNKEKQVKQSSENSKNNNKINSTSKLNDKNFCNEQFEELKQKDESKQLEESKQINEDKQIEEDKENRTYFVIDMKSFYASVECAERNLDPVKTKLVVADKERSNYSVCLAVSIALKKLGVKNRCRLNEVPTNLNFIIAKPRMKKYIDYCANIYALYLKYFDKNDIHVYSIDECFIDVTGYLKLYKISAKKLALKLIYEIYQNFKIPASVGIGTNLFLAKVALDILAKHSANSVAFLNQQLFKNLLWQYEPLTDFWGISTGISTRLKKFGVQNFKQLAMFDKDRLFKEFGVNAEILIDHSKGIEPCLMQDIKNYKKKSKSISSSQILPFAYTYDKAEIVLKEMVQNCCLQLTKSGQYAGRISLLLGYNFASKKSDKISLTLSEKTNLYSSLIDEFKVLFNKIVDKNFLIRKIGISFGLLSETATKQLNFFEDENLGFKESDLNKAVIQIHNKYGKNSLLKGLDLFEGATQKERNNQIGGHSSGES